ncbi:MAG: hypothetical protein AAGU11_00895 [Syntrophobacteraceae bacterium]
MKCHICEMETSFICDRCDEPVCEYCCTPMTIHNQIDYPLCKWCNEGREAEIALMYYEEEKAKRLAKAKREAINASARANYNKPENVEKRRLARIERKKKQAERAKEMLAETIRLVNGWFG